MSVIWSVDNKKKKTPLDYLISMSGTGYYQA